MKPRKSNRVFHPATVSALALLLGSALPAGAAYTISVTTSPTITTSPGSNGQSYFDVSFSGGGNFTYVSKNLWAVDTENNPLIGVDSPFSSLTVDPSSTLKFSGTYASGSTYRLIVNWTVSDTLTAPVAPGFDQYGIYFNLFVDQPNAVRANAGATDIVNIQTASVPEPSQIAGCALIAGCGGFPFLRGRKQAPRR